jgi:adenylate kinase
MRVIVTGQSGLNKEKFLKDTKDFCNKKDLKAPYKDFVDIEVYQKAQIDDAADLGTELKRRGYEAPGYMDMDEKKLLLAKNEILDEILERWKDKENVILGLHAVYYRRNSFRHVIDWSKLKEFRPDLIVTLIDDVHVTRDRIIKRGYTRADLSRFFTLRDIIVWREVELLMSMTMARNLSVPHKILALNQGPITLYQLMFESRHPKALGGEGKYEVYASFPVTEAEKHGLEDQVDQFRNTIKRYFIVYDPMTIGEKILHNKFFENFQKPFPDKEIVIKHDDKEYRFSSLEVMEIIHDINGQIISRDERLIEQSDMVIAFRPAFSSGSRYELSYAKKTGKVKAFAIIPEEDIKGSPFDISSFVDRYWSRLEGMISDLWKMGLIRKKEIERWNQDLLA